MITENKTISRQLRAGIELPKWVVPSAECGYPD